MKEFYVICETKDGLRHYPIMAHTAREALENYKNRKQNIFWKQTKKIVKIVEWVSSDVQIDHEVKNNIIAGV